jgi:hypothetical protein
MKNALLAAIFVSGITTATGAPTAAASKDQQGPGLASFVNHIRAIDNHAHPNTTDPNDKGADALPLDTLGQIQLPARVRPESPAWITAAKALYGFEGTTLDQQTIKTLTGREQDTPGTVRDPQTLAFAVSRKSTVHYRRRCIRSLPGLGDERLAGRILRPGSSDPGPLRNGRGS